jgi:hypothetical protein
VLDDDVDPATAALVKQLVHEERGRDRKAPELYKPQPPGVGLALFTFFRSIRSNNTN